MAWTNDPKAKDALGFDEAHYDGMDRFRLEAYMHVALKFDKDGIEGAPLAKHRIRVRLDAIREEERARAAAKAAARAKILADNSWKERDTWATAHGNGANLRYVQEGGYRQYTDALLNEKERDGNRGSAIKGPVQETLIGEIYYVSGRRARGNYRGDEAIATIKERYGLPCWGALEAKARMEFRRVLSGIRGDEHSAVKHRFETLHPEAAAAEEWWKTPEWKAVSHYPFNTLMNSWTSRTLGDRDWFNYWIDEGQAEALTATEAGGHDSLIPKWHAAIKKLIDAVPERVIVERAKVDVTDEQRELARQAHAAGIARAKAAYERGDQPTPPDETPLTDEQLNQLAADLAARTQAGATHTVAYQPGIAQAVAMKRELDGDASIDDAKAVAQRDAERQAKRGQVEAAQATSPPTPEPEPEKAKPPEGWVPGSLNYQQLIPFTQAQAAARDAGDSDSLAMLTAELAWLQLVEPVPKATVAEVLAVEAAYGLRLDGLRKGNDMPWVWTDGRAVGILVMPGDPEPTPDAEDVILSPAEADEVADQIDAQQAAEAAAAVEAEEAGETLPEAPDVDEADATLLAMIDTAIKFHEVKTKLQRNIDQWNLIRAAIVAGESSPALKRRVTRAASGARPGGRFYELWIGVRNRISELPDPAP
ncbi:MAG: hypothetical protein F4X59_13790 [Holophagales bacterium]|nr:hypothetical protein [Holophagales bacterium]MYC11186.1 hypothetical protein [Holophagales bacterium]